MFDDSLDIQPYNLKEAYCYNDPVESIYYATQDKWGGRIVTNDMRAVWYGIENLVAKQELIESVFTKTREPLTIYRYCFDPGTNLSFSEKAKNFKRKGQ